MGATDTSMTMGKKRRLRFHVSLSDMEDPMVSLKDLAKEQGVSLGKSKHENGYQPDERPAKLRELYKGGNVIEIIQRKYCGHAGVRDESDEEDEEVVGGQGGAEGADRPKKRRKRGFKNEDYDLDDGFVDDSELLEVFEKQEEATTTVTKYNGFFVNSGDLEVALKLPREAEAGKEPRKRKKRKDAGVPRSRSTEPTTPLPRVEELEAASDDYWPTGPQGEAAIERLREKVAAWRGSGKGDGSALTELPAELEPAVLEVELAVRGGSRSGDLQAPYMSTLEAVLPMGDAAWTTALRSVAESRVKELQDAIGEAKERFTQHYAVKKEQRQKAIEQAEAQAKEAEAKGEPKKPRVHQNVAVDPTLKLCLMEILGSTKETVLLRNLHPKELDGPVWLEEEEARHLGELAVLWPSGIMTHRKLKQHHDNHIEREKRKAEAAKGESQGQGSAPSPNGAAPSSAPASGKKRASSGGAKRKSPGPAPQGERKRARSPKENGGKGKRGKKKAKTEPVFGEIVVEEFTYDPNDFTIQNQ